MNVQELTTRADALLRPISDAAPTGENVAYDPRFEALRTEVGKLDSPAAGDVDWELVAREGQAMLTGASKDILLASYTAYALYQTERLAGLAVGLGLLGGMLDRYWDGCWPPAARMRGRANAIDWLIARLESALPTLDIAPDDRAALDVVIAGYRRLSEIARAKMQDAAPGFGGVSEILQRLDLKIPKAAAPANDAPAAVQPAANVPTSGPGPAPADAPPPAAANVQSQGPGAAPADAPPPPAANTAAPEASTPASTPAPAPAPAAPAPEPPKDDPVAKVKAAAEAWLRPISSDKPIGNEARYDADYEATRVEVAKLESTTLEEPNWEEVSRACDGILKNKSKDVLAASWLAYAKFQLQGVDGLAVGLAIVAGMFEAFPDERWPSRPRGQGNAVGWLTGLLELRLADWKPTPKDRPQVLALHAITKSFSSIVRDKLEDHAPSLRPLEERIQRILLSIPEPKPEPPKAAPPPAPAAAPSQAPAAPPPAAAAPSTAPLPAATADVGSAEEASKYLLETGRSMVKVANILRRAQLTSPAAYRLLRIGLYLHLDAAPPAGPGGKTQIPPLPEPRRKQFELIAANEKWAALIEETESAVGQFRFALDLHRLSAQALEGLGPEYAGALEALLTETASLLRRMPGLPDLQAADGSPLASADTKAWLAQKVVATAGGGAGGGTGATDDPGEALEKARALLTGGKGADALELAKTAIGEAAHPRLRFIRQLALAEACLAADQIQLAKAMFAALDEQLRERGLMDWEPALASRCLEGLVRAIRAAIKKGAKADGSGMDAAFERLSTIDPVAAARLATQ